MATFTGLGPCLDEGDPRLRVALIGGGASGTLTAIHLLRAGVRVTVFERTGRLGHGLAYSTTDPRHLLNVRAGEMSAFPDEPDDLVRWAAGAGLQLGPTDFLPRRDYARYLCDRLAPVADGLVVVGAEVDDIEPTDAGFRVLTAERHGVRESSEYDAVVLATGNGAPAPLVLGGGPLPAARWHIPDPWDLTWLDGLAPDAVVVLVGSGLTAVDTAISVLEDWPRRRVVMVSRHGLLPERHLEEQVGSVPVELPQVMLTADAVAEAVRAAVAEAAERGIDWRAVVNGLRGPTQSIWQRLPLGERRRFLEVYAREWEVRRHRMAPEVAGRIADYRADGRLRVVAGGVDRIDGSGDPTAERPVVVLGGESLAVDAVVNCTGPVGDVTRGDNALLRRLAHRGLIRADALRLGVDALPDGCVRAADGVVVPGLFTVGPPRKGVLYETTAIPEIRVQAAEVAALVVDSALRRAGVRAAG